MFFRDILTIPTVTKNIYTLKFPFSLQEKGDCDHIRTLFIGGKNTAHIALNNECNCNTTKFEIYQNTKIVSTMKYAIQLGIN